MRKGRLILKKVFLVVLFSVLLKAAAFANPGTIVTYTIDPEKNAFDHNNKGVMYVDEKCYYAAIQEFKIAISLNPRTQATAVYFTNLGNVYMTIGYPNLALDCFKNAIIQYNLNFDYYKNLANCYNKLGQVSQQLAIYRKQAEDKPTAKVMVGLLEELLGDKKKAIMTFDEFVVAEPDLIITPAVKLHIKELVDEIDEL